MLTHHAIEHFRAILFCLMVCGPALAALIAYLAPRLYPASVQAMVSAEEADALARARTMFAEADQLDRDARAVSAYFARFSAVRVPASTPRAAALRAAAWTLVGSIVASGVLDNVGGL